MADVIAICGSYRTKSLNRKLMRLAVRECRQLGLAVDEVDLKLLALPVYDGDDEEATGLPPAVVELKAKISAAPGLLIVSPEYNAGVPGGLKNAIDWVSRPQGNPFANRVVSVNNASDGAFGGARSTIALKTTLSHLGAWIVPGAANLPKAQHAFTEDGELTEDWMKKMLANAMKTFAEGVRRFK